MARADDLFQELDKRVVDDPAEGFARKELAGCVWRRLAMYEVAKLRPGLTPEFSVFDSSEVAGGEEATAGVVDEIAWGEDGTPKVAMDWKANVNPNENTLEQYRAQVGAYLELTGAKRGSVFQ